MHDTWRKIANRETVIEGHFNQISRVLGHSEKFHFSWTYSGHSRTVIIFQVFKVFQDVWES